MNYGGTLKSNVNGQFTVWHRKDGFLNAAIRLQFITSRGASLQLLFTMIPPLTVVRSLAFSPTVNFLVLINRSTGDLGYDELRVADYTAALKPLAPQMSLRRSTGAGACTLTLQGEAGRWYLVLASSNLTMWVEVTNFTNASDTKEITEPVPVGSQRFYRAIAR